MEDGIKTRRCKGGVSRCRAQVLLAHSLYRWQIRVAPVTSEFLLPMPLIEITNLSYDDVMNHGNG